MYEIEMKAHVKNRESVIGKLNSFAEFIDIIEKSDRYFRLEKADGNHITARIRSETHKFGNPENFSTAKVESFKNILTYKRKENRLCTNGTTIEVNDENETEISSPECMEKLLCDIGFTEYLKKTKSTAGWNYVTEAGTAHIELCTVPPLGDFLEIEVISPDNDTENVGKINRIIESLFLRTGIELSEIEPRYYSEMLKESCS